MRGVRFMPDQGTMLRMGSINEYILRTTLGAFLIVLVSLTAVIWVTQALRDIDIMTSQGQTILVFVGITGLIIPLLILVIAPIALLIAVAHVLNKLSNDSEIIVMNAAGMSPWVLFRAFIAAALVVSLLVGAISAYFAPKGLRMLRDWLTEVRANVVSSIVQPGRFTTIENGVTIHIRERRPNGQLAGIFLDDRRNPNERITVLSEIGELLENESGTYLVLQKGIVQRQETGQRDPAMVVFDRYAFDLSQFAGGAQSAKYSIRERYLWQLLFPDPKDQFYIEQPGQFRAELHDRLMAPLYPLAFVVIAYAYLGAPRTTRQSRTLSMLGAIGGVALLRLIGFASTVFGATIPWVLALQYLTLAAAIGAGLYVIRRGVIIEPPVLISDWLAALTERLGRRFVAP
ncbi:MAG TPA: LPS export ABC transporter permease LptF [Pseudolabrys sp.]|nr:LPS export ABC transporter permease LptF [Pseudolabrys sp.]